jgi:hypothetical protein
MADELKDEGAAPTASLVSVLPHALTLNIFSLLPVDARARAKLVCVIWGTALADASLWTRLDLSRSSGVTVAVTDEVLRGASGLARGGVVALDVSGCEHRISRVALLAVLTANAGALRELSACEVCTEALANRHYGFVQMLWPELLLDAPNLRLRSINVATLRCFSAEAQSLLRNELPFGSLRVRRVSVHFGEDDDAPLGEVLAGVAEHASLSGITLFRAPLAAPALLDAVVDVALSRRFELVTLFNCRLSPASVPSLPRLVRNGALTELNIVEYNDGPQVFLEAPSAALLCDALRANTTLTSLHLDGVCVGGKGAVTAAVLGALTAHPSLCTLSCCGWSVDDGDAATIIGAALGALVASNAPALQSLSLPYANLRDVGLGPLLHALMGNTHLTELDISGNGMSEECARDQLLPAVRANTSLRSLCMNGDFDSAREAEALVESRAPQ